MGVGTPAIECIEAGQALPDPATRKLLAFFLDAEEADLGGEESWPVQHAGSTLGQVIRAARESRGWSQDLLARVVGAKDWEIVSYEEDEMVPSPDRLAHMGEALRVRFVQRLPGPGSEETTA